MSGVIRKVDQLGRVVIPETAKRATGIKEGVEVEIFEDIDKIILQKYSPPETNSNLNPKPPQTQNP